MFKVFAWWCFGGVFQGRHFPLSLTATVTRYAIAMSQRLRPSQRFCASQRFCPSQPCDVACWLVIDLISFALKCLSEEVTLGCTTEVHQFVGVTE